QEGFFASLRMTTIGLFPQTVKPVLLARAPRHRPDQYHARLSKRCDAARRGARLRHFNLRRKQMKREWTRRQALRAVAIFGFMTASLSQMAVSCANLFAEILAYISVGLQGFSSIENILAGFGVIPI